MESSQSLELELKHLIVETLMLEDVKPADINSEEALFNDGLGLDSIDALELGMAISKTYEIKMSQDPEENSQHFANVRNLAKFVQSKIQETQGPSQR